MKRHEHDPADRLDALQERGRALLSIQGLWCASCAAATERVIRSTPGVSQANVSFATSAALVSWDPERVELAELAHRVAKLGYRLGAPMDTDETVNRIDSEVERLGIRLAFAALFGMWTMLFSILLYLDSGGIAGPPSGWWIALAAGVAAVPVVTVTGAPIFIAGWRTLRTGVPGMDTLIGIGASAALGLSVWQLAHGQADVYFDTAVMLITLLTVGRLIETRTLRHAARAIGALQDALPETAVRLGSDAAMTTLPADQIDAGATIRVAAGQRIALDGRVVAGESRLDCAALTGESAPVDISRGDVVEAGAINLVSPLNVRVEGVVGERTIDRIGARIAEAAGAKGETQRLADRVARIVVPVALGLAAVTAMLALITGLPLQDALLRAVSVLVVACPCAVGIAVPIAYVAAASRAARRGVLFRHPAALESMAGVTTLLLDKTGTLTEGRLRLAEVCIHDRSPGLPTTRQAVIDLAALAEQDVDHAIAQAFHAAASPSLEPSDLTERAPQRSGRGVRLQHRHYGEVLVGSEAFLEAHGIICRQEKRTAIEQTCMRVEIAAAGRWLATATLDDRLRADAPAAIRRLRQAGVDCAIVTGDVAGPAHAIAEQLGISPSHVFMACTPHDKADIVRQTPGVVAFAGDGVNDGPALAEADVGLAVAAATPTATAAAGIAISHGGVMRLADTLDYARRARRVMRQNLTFAVAYNAAGLSLAAFGMIPPVVAALAMAASSLTVVANATRLANGNGISQGSSKDGLATDSQ